MLLADLLAATLLGCTTGHPHQDVNHVTIDLNKTAPIVSIERAAAGADRNCNWLQKGIRLEVNNMPKSLRSIMQA